MKNRTALLSAAAIGAMALAGAAHAQDTTTAWKGAPQFQNDTLTFKVRGRVYFDVVNQDVDFEDPAATDLSSTASRIRTARLGVEGTWNQNWGYKAEASISSGGGSTQWEDLILEYKPTDTASVMIGNFKSTGFENISSSRYITFMERGPFTDVMDNGRVMTAAVKANGEAWTLTGFVHGDSVNNTDPAVGSSEQFGYGARGTFAPINGDATKLHLGGSARFRDRGKGAAPLFNYQVRNNTNFGGRYTTTGGIGDKDSQYAAEFLLIHKSLSLQAEYAVIDVERANGASEDLDAFYVSASWFPTGEMRNLDVRRGELGRTRILNPVTAGGFGAVELAVRYDSVDLSEAFTQAAPPVAAVSALAGQYEAWTLGATWYPFPYVRFMVNYTDSENDLTPVLRAAPLSPTAPDVKVKTLQFRAQYDF
jgi:phosphate-selective porin OprO/OprP